MTLAHYTREERRALARDNAKQPSMLTRTHGWQNRPNLPDGLIEVWRSREFLAQVYTAHPGIVRVSVNRASIDTGSGRWTDGISWDELQRVKREIGRGHLDAVEVYPADRDIVNVANMRHLFVFDEPLPFVWRKERL